jgi:hypothetical protein
MASAAGVVGATLDELQLSALWRSGPSLLPGDGSVGQRLVWLGMVTITFAGVVVGASLTGPAMHGAAASIVIIVGIGLVLANLVGVFVLAARADPRPTSRTYMERHVAARRLVARSDGNAPTT